MKEKNKKMELLKISVDELFTTQEQRECIDVVVNIAIKDIDDFPEHPFGVFDDELLENITKSIKEKRYVPPAIVRMKNDGRYQMVSGHRRKLAFMISKESKMPCIIKNLSDEDATILMVDTNINQRQKILPSERAKAYKMKMEALKKQGKRNDLTSDPMGWKLSGTESAQIVGEKNGDSATQVRRYIRLNELIPEILKMVDLDKIAFRPAVEISYLSEDNQYILLDIMQFSEITPSLAQAINMKKLQQEDKLDADKIEDIMSQQKPNQVEKFKINAERFVKVFPKNVVTNKEREDFLFMCVEEHNKRVKMREMSR